MHKAQNVVGRLVEVRFASPLTLDEVRQFVGEHHAIIKRLARKYIGVVDLLQADVFPVPVAEALIQLLSTVSPQLERTALLIRDSAVFALQVERVIRNSNHPDRRVFRDPEALQAWLGEVLDVQEQARLAQFVDDAVGRR
ncbi:MAG: hypothetical protein QOH06_5339 [Acidobacteriota bacterium]|jgi:hypothetical protein|nr:hypothetical protein [Acidobacteriota bacterium]